ncbi:hypothetical protein AAG570_010484 [Ranatra chinensis]|uniref:LisH domain-containing protein n=1 Tax=Ranatra chinensis TaxID=642074 RepID=A0ABD0YPU2_9HEMI
MESFLPSEVARLVYGYLEEENCMAAAQAFLESSDHLQECLAVSKKGRKFNTRILGRNLISLLDLLSEVASLIKEYTIEVGWDSPAKNKLTSILRLLQLEACLEKCSRSPSLNITSTSHGFDSPPVDGLGDTRKAGHNPQDLHQFKPEVMANVLMNMKTDTYNCDDPVSIPEMESATVCDEPYKKMMPMQIHQVHQMHQMSQHQQSQIVVHMVGPSPLQQPPPPAPPPSQSQPLQSQHPGVPTTVYMAAMAHRPEQNSMSFQSGTIQPIVSCSTTVPTSHQPLWTNPQDISMFHNIVKGPSGVDHQGNQSQGKPSKKRPRIRNNVVRPRVVPKLRPIAPKITQILENGIEVQVVHTKETPLVDLAETIPSVNPPRRSQRCKSTRTSTNNNSNNVTPPPKEGSMGGLVMGTNLPVTPPTKNSDSPPETGSSPTPGQSPPSPVFIDIHSLDLKR